MQITINTLVVSFETSILHKTRYIDILCSLAINDRMVVIYIDEIERLSPVWVRSNHQEFLLWFFFWITFVITQVIISHFIIAMPPQIVCPRRIDFITIIGTNRRNMPFNPIGIRSYTIIMGIVNSTIHIQINGLHRFIFRISKKDALISIHERLYTKIVGLSSSLRSCRIIHP